MEFLNKIELQGIVGTVQINTVQGKSVARFSLLVEEAFHATDGTAVVQSTWFNCTAWQGDKIKDLTKIQKGKTVHLKGKVRVQQYTTQEGNRHLWEIICNELTVSKP